MFNLNPLFILLGGIIVLISAVNGSGLCQDQQVKCVQMVNDLGCWEVGRYCPFSCGLCVTTPSTAPVTLPKPIETLADCSEAYSRGWTKDGQQSVSILPATTQLVTVWCQKGWTLAQRRTTENNAFYYNPQLIKYENGLGDVMSDHWLGLRHQHTLTSLRPQRMRLEMLWDDKYGDSEVKWVECQSFSVGSKSSGWKLSVAKCVSNLPLNPLVLYQNGAKFQKGRYARLVTDDAMIDDFDAAVPLGFPTPTRRPSTAAPTYITKCCPGWQREHYGYWWNSDVTQYASINDQSESSWQRYCSRNNRVCSHFYKYIKSSQMMMHPA